MMVLDCSEPSELSNIIVPSPKWLAAVIRSTVKLSKHSAYADSFIHPTCVVSCSILCHWTKDWLTHVSACMDVAPQGVIALHKVGKLQ